MMDRLGKVYDRMLWWSYKRFEWGQQFVSRRVTFCGWFVVMLSGLGAVFGLNVVSDALIYLSCLGGVMLLVDWMSLWFRRMKVEVKSLPGSKMECDEGSSVEVGFRTHSQKGHYRYRIALFPQDQCPSFERFYEAREPGEGKRNIVDRILKFYRWKWLRREYYTPFDAGWSEEVREGGDVTLRIACKLRGAWPLENVRVQVKGVFGLLERSLRVRESVGVLSITPRVYPVTMLGLEGGGGEDAQMESSQAVGDSLEFMSLREYRPGDSMRRVNWKAMARTGKVMVTEMEEMVISRYLIIWEGGEMNEKQFETGASVVASLVNYMTQAKERAGVLIRHGGERYYDLELDYEQLMLALASIQLSEPWEGAEAAESQEGVEIIVTARDEADGARYLRVGEGIVNDQILKGGIEI